MRTLLRSLDPDGAIILGHGLAPCRAGPALPIIMRDAATAEPARWVAPLDRLRSEMFGVAKRLGLSDVLATRDRRLAAIALSHLAFVFPLAVLATPLLLIFGPLVLGVPHLVGDVRHMVLRRQLPSSFRAAVYASCAGLIALRALEEIGWQFPARAEMIFVSAAIVAAASAGPRGAKRPAVVLGALAVAVGFIGNPRVARLAMLHGHNIIALVVWLVLFRRSRRAVRTPMLLTGFVFVLLSSGTLAPVTEARGLDQFFGMSTSGAALFLAPGLEPGALTVGITSGFAFLQSVHYAVWLIYVPQDDTHHQGSRSFRRSVRDLIDDVGVTALSVALVVGLAVVAFAFIDALQARALYLSLASFHGYFEVAMLFYFLGRTPEPAA